MAKSVVQLSCISLLVLSLFGCGGGSNSEPTNSVNNAENSAPQCTSNKLETPRGSGAVQINTSLSCSDADGDSLSFAPNTVQSDGAVTGEHTLNVTVSDGRGGQTEISFLYQITNQAPVCSQNIKADVSPAAGRLDVARYVSCIDSNGDAIAFTPSEIDISNQQEGSYQQQVSYSDGELSAQFNLNYSVVVDVQSELTRCELVSHSVSLSPESDVVVSCDDNYAYIKSDTYPSHDLMNGIKATNEQIPVPAVDYSAPIKLSPHPATNPTTIDAALGVAINGVPIYDYSAAGELDLVNYNPGVDTVALGQLDNCGGHAGRGDDYHYHTAPTCMMAAMETLNDDTIIGWGYDGYPLYGYNQPDGSKIESGDLELCNGMADDTFGYRYHLSSEPPYVFQCLVGEVDTSILLRVAPLTGGLDRADLRPPAGDVQNLKHTIDSNGKRTMSYDYQGENYYVSYTPSQDKVNCYDFEMKAISNQGEIQTGTYCR
ncbi:YHYH protein [Pseudoalteromonas obscura]|uniref:YHYH protein n=1 Tax=Pseudoalteromonas obscura TaxID=3048491 RepID=A0ABT7EGU9_9GAMM|nr:YHYH protein [Pseudoalteromonas sp. P94(2023)]MDK2594249.1 YHYH protein [Pseudoalteromonas sp. P94(2023)]